MSNETIISLKDIYKDFEDKKVCRGINLEIKRGEILALIGGSGTGKTVILRHIIGLLKPDSGQVVFDDKDITDYDENQLVEIRTRIAMLFQGGALFDSLSVFENVAYALREHTKLTEEEIEKKVRTELEHLGIAGTENLYPSDLSGGMQRRVGFARSVILQPEVILFDEPTTGLDPFNIHNVIESIKDLNKRRGTTCIVVTHDMVSMSKIAHRIAMLHEGNIRKIGPAEEVLKSDDPVVKSFITGITAEGKE
ncbi:ABC transporter ATP-binding protein [Bdellovibrionota bacterium]